MGGIQNLFNCNLKEIFCNLKWAKKKGLKINGEYLNNLGYTDDIILFQKIELSLKKWRMN